MSRAAEVAASIPLANRFIIGLCVAVFLLQTILNLDLQDFTLCPRNVIYDHEYYRIFTSCVFHGGLIHIGFNMMSTAAIGSLLEKRFGTLRHIFSVFLGMFLTSSTYILVACLLSWVCRYDKLMYQHSVGFSGVLFQLWPISVLTPQDQSLECYKCRHTSIRGLSWWHCKYSCHKYPLWVIFREYSWVHCSSMVYWML